MGSVFIDAALKFLSAHPDIVEELINQIALAIVKALKDHNASASV